MPQTPDIQPTTFVIPTWWSPNIGNAFFALGIQHALATAVPNAQVVLMSDQAAYLNLIPGLSYRREPKNSLSYLDYVRPDYLVLAGSVLTEQFPRVWGRTLEKLADTGTKLLLIGVGYYDYSESERAACRTLLEQYPPYVLISRDRTTYQDLRDVADYAYDGLDGAYFLPDVYQPVATDMPPYIMSNFDKIPEPIFSIEPQAADPTGNGYQGGNGQGSQTGQIGQIGQISQNGQDGHDETLRAFVFQDQHWQVRFPRIHFTAARYLSKSYGHVMAPLGLYGTSQVNVGGYMIVRTDHQLNPLMPSRIFRGPNAFAGDTPYSYLNLYSQAALTLSDRIHAVLATLAYGKPAMLFSKSGRAHILERMGAGDVTKHPITLDLERLEQEKEAELAFLRSVSFESVRQLSSLSR